MSFIRQITLENFLSFRGPATVELEPLNILIGGNGTGKSNFIRAIEVLGSLPVSLQNCLLRMGGPFEAFWKGSSVDSGSQFKVQCAMQVASDFSVDYKLAYQPLGSPLRTIEESLVAEGTEIEGPISNLFFRRDETRTEVILSGSTQPFVEKDIYRSQIPSLNPLESVFGQIRGPQVRPAMQFTAAMLGGIRIFDRWDTSRLGPMRGPQSTTKIPHELLPDGSNLALVVSHLESKNVISQIEEQMKKFNPRIKRIGTSTQGNSIQIIFSENSLSSAVSAFAASDGSLQYLALLCVLLHPSHAPLVCFEEPECGLHPDAIPLLAQLLRDASERMQIIVSTHSDRLVDCFSDKPECVLVTDRDEETGETVFERLDREELKVWLEKYRLGKLWTSGQIGGVIG